MGELEEFLTIDEVAAWLKRPKNTLYSWRWQRKGPVAFKVGRELRYRPADVVAWMEDARAGEQPPAPPVPRQRRRAPRRSQS